jgi:hypothetical protein
MKTFLLEYKNQAWELEGNNVEKLLHKKINLVLCFAQKYFLESSSVHNDIKQLFPHAEIVFCSTAGEILGNKVSEKDGILVAMEFEKTSIQTATININNCTNSFDAAKNLVNKLPKKDLNYIMVFCDGSLINGSELVKGLSEAAGADVKISGGLAGDGANFASTLVGLNSNPSNGQIVIIGFYGNALSITHGSKGGWTPFGLEKRITKSSNNILHELENENALDVYKKYLGNSAKDLPGAALLFPLSIVLPNAKEAVVRTILSIDEEQKTMTFVGDMPVGTKVRFMHANIAELTNAASEAAKISMQDNNIEPNFSLLVSCVGRKLVMGNNAVDEVNAVIQSVGNNTKVAGFYSYGEIAPFNDGGNCQLHNQTMTITSFYETV